MDVTNNNDKREAFYVRSGTSSIVAKGEVLDELRDMASRVPFDGRGNPDIKEDDIDYVLIREYLQSVKSRMVGELKRLMDLLERMDLLTGPSERRMIKNVAAMMFCNRPEKITPILPHSCPILAQNTLEMIMQNPKMTVKQLSKALGLSGKTIKIRLTLLKKEGIIIRVGNNRTGYWEVVGNVEK